MVAKELLGSDSDLTDEFRRELTKIDMDFLQRLRSALNDSEAPGEAVETKGDNVKTQEVVATVKDRNGPSDLNEPQYCLCNKGSAGIMIRCDNVDVSLHFIPSRFDIYLQRCLNRETTALTTCQTCKYKWFHLECVGLTVAPSSKDKWYCPDCRGHVHIGEKEDIDPQALPSDSRNSKFAMETEVCTIAP